MGPLLDNIPADCGADENLPCGPEIPYGGERGVSQQEGHQGDGGDGQQAGQKDGPGDRKAPKAVRFTVIRKYRN